MREIFAKILYETEKNNDLCLVTLIDSDGSAPRKTGSQMLVGSKGHILGSIGGGAVEHRSVSMAQQLIEEKKSDVHPFRLHANDEDDIGMICGGDVTAHFQFIAADDPVWHQLCGKAAELFSAQKSGWFVTRLDGGTPALLDQDLNLLCGNEPEGSRPAGAGFFSSGTCFWQPLPLAERVLIFGGGHISAALVPILSNVGFRCWVIDDRPEFTTKDRFPQAEQRITCDFAHVGNFIELNDEDYAVIMTNGHAHDLECEEFVLRRPFAYIGVIGSAKKTASVNAKLRERGIQEKDLACIHTPIGTPIKAVTPEEIAISIAGEMILVRAERREAKGIKIHSCPMH